LRKQIESEKDASREAERELFAAMARRSELQSILAALRSKEELLAREEATMKQDMGEAAVLVGREAVDDTVVRDHSGAEVTEAEMLDEPRSAQEDRRRKLERLKIKLEESGLVGASEVLKEHKETSERDTFLARELEDLEASRTALLKLIEELTQTLETRFGDGVQKINKEFDTFFKLMFGGGSASLSVVSEKKLRRGASEEDTAESDDEDMEVEEGVEIGVTLPHKRTKGLHMLSGGERALTSIALIFAMSQVNPPPFLILDETDAALDEANSRRYGDMIENLAKKSQLILITHNRETMSRAGVLYGITVGSDAASKLLSVKFEEALAVAK
jgi:chromosome segregation protein